MCLSAAGEIEVDCSVNSLIATRSGWDNFQRSGSGQPSTSALFSSVTYHVLGLSLSLTTAQRKENNLGSTSTQPHQIFPHLPPAVLERNGINQSEAGFSYHVPFPSVHFCKKRPLYIYAPHSKQRLCPWLMALLIETKQTWFDLMSLVDVIWLGLSRCYWMIYHCCFGLLLSACKISHLTPSEIPIEEMSWTLDKH